MATNCDQSIIGLNVSIYSFSRSPMLPTLLYFHQYCCNNCQLWPLLHHHHYHQSSCEESFVYLPFSSTGIERASRVSDKTLSFSRWSLLLCQFSLAGPLFAAAAAAALFTARPQWIQVGNRFNTFSLTSRTCLAPHRREREKNNKRTDLTIADRFHGRQCTLLPFHLACLALTTFLAVADFSRVQCEHLHLSIDTSGVNLGFQFN